MLWAMLILLALPHWTLAGLPSKRTCREAKDGIEPWRVNLFLGSFLHCNVVFKYNANVAPSTTPTHNRSLLLKLSAILA